jgi:uncharacterized protein YecE (DUF72 family)
MGTLSNVRIGISGWRYKGWRGVFYPKGLAQRRELVFASRQFDTIELNGSFYSLQRPLNFEQWAADTPENFIFSIKGSRYITHMLRLKEVKIPLANFFAQGLLKLGPKFGPILWQLPPNMEFDLVSLEKFFSLLPKTHVEAAELGRSHDDRLRHRAWLKVTRNAPLRHAIEIRHESFACEKFIQSLRQHGIALVVADTVEWPLLMDVTSDFVYCRLHGSEELYASGYDDKALTLWAHRVVTWATGGEVTDGRKASGTRAVKRRNRDVFVYCDNDRKVKAPVDAAALRERVSQSLDIKRAG